MAFAVAQYFSRSLQVARRLTSRFRARCNLTPQERANLYVSHMPLAVITASLGGHPAGMERNVVF